MGCVKCDSDAGDNIFVKVMVVGFVIFAVAMTIGMWLSFFPNAPFVFQGAILKDGIPYSDQRYDIHITFPKGWLISPLADSSLSADQKNNASAKWLITAYPPKSEGLRRVANIDFKIGVVERYTADEQKKVVADPGEISAGLIPGIQLTGFSPIKPPEVIEQNGIKINCLYLGKSVRFKNYSRMKFLYYVHRDCVVVVVASFADELDNEKFVDAIIKTINQTIEK
jgi:hypothetical protein